jgi:hypothetical protein
MSKGIIAFLRDASDSEVDGVGSGNGVGNCGGNGGILVMTLVVMMI